MSHPQVTNETPFAFEALFTMDEDATPVVVPLVQATYQLRGSGKLALAEEQAAVNLGGEAWGTPESSYKHEPQIAFAAKPATDVVLIGNAVAAGGRIAEMDVTLRVGRLQKTVHILGDRVWTKRIGGGIGMTSPQPFESIPLVYERAFGGWDRSSPEEKDHRCEPRNPVGTGFRNGRAAFQEGIRLPNLEEPRHPIKSFTDTPPPAAFGFVSPGWQPRATLAGTYDDTWLRTRMPALPADFDRRFFNAASPGLSGAIVGGEAVVVEGVGTKGPISFALPKVPSPTCIIEPRGRAGQHAQTRLDTVVIDADTNRLLLLWRGITPVHVAAHEVRAIRVAAEGVPIHTQTG